MAHHINPGVIYFRETSRSGQVLWEEVLCNSCYDEMTAEKLKPGEGRRIARPWANDPVDCTRCTANAIDPKTGQQEMPF